MLDGSTEVGAGISSIKLKKKDNEVSKHLARYLFSPLLSINLGDRNMTGAMSKLVFQKGRIANFEDCPYKVRDESSDVLLDSETDSWDQPLVEKIHTAADQAFYLYSSYGERGVVNFEELIGFEPEDVVEIEQAVLPEYFDTVIELQQYLQDEARVKENIKASGISGTNLKAAKAVVKTLSVGTAMALKYASDWLMEAKAEIIQSRNGKGGKSSHDPFDAEMYRQTGLPILRERDVDFASAGQQAKEAGNDKLASALERIADHIAKGEEKEAADGKIAAMELQLGTINELLQNIDPEILKAAAAKTKGKK